MSRDSKDSSASKFPRPVLAKNVMIDMARTLKDAMEVEFGRDNPKVTEKVHFNPGLFSQMQLLCQELTAIATMLEGSVPPAKDESLIPIQDHLYGLFGKAKGLIEEARKARAIEGFK